MKLGDFIRIDLDSQGKLTFVKEAEGALVPVLLERYGPDANAHAAAASKAGKMTGTSRGGREFGTAIERK